MDTGLADYQLPWPSLPPSPPAAPPSRSLKAPTPSQRVRPSPTGLPERLLAAPPHATIASGEGAPRCRPPPLVTGRRPVLPQRTPPLVRESTLHILSETNLIGRIIPPRLYLVVQPSPLNSGDHRRSPTVLPLLSIVPPPHLVAPRQTSSPSSLRHMGPLFQHWARCRPLSGVLRDPP